VTATNDTLLIGDASDSNALKRITVANFAQTLPTAKITTGTIDTATLGTTTGTAATLTNGTIQTLTSSTATITGGTFSGSINSTSGTIATLNSTTGTIPTLVATTLITTGTGTAAAPAIVPTGDTNTGIFFPAADTIAFAEGGAESIRIDASGNVGIGTTSPGTKLDVLAPTNSGMRVTNGTMTGIFFNSADTSIAIGSQTNHPVNLYANSILSATIGTNGNVGIGTTSPQKELQINATEPTIRLEENGAGSKRLELSINSNAEAKIFANQSGGQLLLGTVGTERLRIDSSGRVQIGTTQDFGNTTRVEVQFDGGGSEYGLGLNASTIQAATQWIQFTSGTGTARGSIDWSGTQVRYNTSSDYRLKENITGITDGIARLKQLKPSRFSLIEYPGEMVDGFIAHEVSGVVPEAVSGEKDAVNQNGSPVYQGIDQSKIVPLLTAALKEAVAKIETLEAKVAALEAV
jgi:hypothetical protein